MRYVVLVPLAAALGVSATGSAFATPTLDSIKIFASGSAVGGTQPDSVTVGSGSVWIEYGNGADSTNRAIQ